MARTKTSPNASRLAVILSAVAGGILGALAGFAHEVRRPPAFEGGARSADESREGKKSPTFRLGDRRDSGDWDRVLAAVAKGEGSAGELVLGEGDLNRIAREYLGFTAGKRQRQASGEGLPSFAILPDTPNFALEPGSFQALVPFEVALFGSTREGWFAVRGTFSSGAAGPVFAPEEAWINSARLPAPVAGFLLGRLAANVRSSGDDSPLLAAWKNLGKIRIEDGSLHLKPR